MPHHKSCKKRMRTSEEARLRNRAYRSRVKTLTRKVRKAESRAAAEADLRKAISLLDRLSRKGIIHRNNAAHNKSKLQRHVNSLPA